MASVKGFPFFTFPKSGMKSTSLRKIPANQSIQIVLNLPILLLCHSNRDPAFQRSLYLYLDSVAHIDAFLIVTNCILIGQAGHRTITELE